ncbi:spore germination protein [Shouchella clausii]|nr:spore germination protein [Shouchella clausii]SPT79421.1 spore germination protein KA [Niallia circulans]MCM3549200.1 spore germination protein [Shouchella clausii]MCY1102945.1 spore germination protein [Shouchella clausii]MEB5479446.1 spore germination protein [Shouchella clausii]MED4159870.1 spore germination protein [Shouchella clausii]
MKQSAPPHDDLANKMPSSHLADTIDFILTTTGHSEDILVRPFSFGRNQTLKAAFLYVEGLCNEDAVEKMISRAKFFDEKEPDVFERAQQYLEEVGHTETLNRFRPLMDKLFTGYAICLIDGFSTPIAVAVPLYTERPVSEPMTEKVVRGSREGFVENVRTNISLLRRRIGDEQLWIETRTIGTRTKTKIMIAYMNDIVDKSILRELHTRLDRIYTDSVLEDGNIEELIEDQVYTPFPTVYSTERPDTTAAHLLEGKIAILSDGSPMALIVPALFVQFFHNAEDHTQRADIGTLIRLLRFMCIFIAMLAPSFYIAITTFHQELIPTELLGNLAAQQEGTPFPTFVETLMMEVTFEILREAGIRMPQPVGQAVSIVGAIVIGQAAVQAGIVSAAVVIVISITAIASFVFPTYSIGVPIRILRFGFMAFAASFGLLGICIGFTAVLLHLSTLKSFGIPYLKGLSPFVWKDQTDTIFRAPKWLMNERPEATTKFNQTRQRTPKPSPKD